MTITPLAEDPHEILVRHILDGTLNATPEGVALVAYVCDFVATEPSFAGLHRTADDLLMGALAGDIGANVPLGTVAGFFRELRLVCARCGLTDTQTETVLDTARRKIG